MADFVGTLLALRESLITMIAEIDKSIPDLNEEEKLVASLMEEKRVIISCDGSVVTNPGGPASVGVVVSVPGNKTNIEMGKVVPGKTNNDAEFAAVYLGLSNTLPTIDPGLPIVVESDSKLVIDSLNGKCNLKEERLSRKRDLILELAHNSLSSIQFIWRRRNSTSGLRRANAIAQAINGVKPH